MKSFCDRLSGGTLLDTIVLKKDESVYSTPLILKEGNLLIYGTEKGDITAYDLKNKKEIWKINPVNDRIVFPLLGDDNAVIIFYRAGGTILCVNPLDGSVLWRKNIPELSRTAFSPVFSGGKAAFAADTPSGSYIKIIDALSGKKEPPIRLSSQLASFILDGNNLYIASSSGKVYSYNIAARKYEWTYQTGLETAFMTADRGGVYVINAGQVLKIIR